MKKKLRTILAATAVMTLAAVCFGGCGSGSDAKLTSGEQADQTGEETSDGGAQENAGGTDAVSIDQTGEPRKGDQIAVSAIPI